MLNILIINVLNQSDKLKRAQSKIAQLNLINAKVFTINAITPSSIPPGWSSNHVKFKKRLLSPGEIACACSHVKALKAASLGAVSRLFKAFYAGADYVKFCKFIYFIPALPGRISLILEDDVIFYPKIAEVLDSLSKEISLQKFNVEILLLGHHLQLYADDGYLIPSPLKRRSKREFLRHFWAKHAGMSVGAYCYAVDKSSAFKLAKMALPISRPADWLTHNNEQINALFAYPSLAICEHENSLTIANFTIKKRSKISKIFKNVKFQIRYFFTKYFL